MKYKVLVAVCDKWGVDLATYEELVTDDGIPVEVKINDSNFEVTWRDASSLVHVLNDIEMAIISTAQAMEKDRLKRG